MAQTEKGVVTISTQSATAWSEPQFIIEHEGKFYVTVAVLEFDPKSKEAAYREGSQEVQSAFKKASKVNAGVAGAAASFLDLTGVQTFRPPPKAPPPGRPKSK